MSYDDPNGDYVNGNRAQDVFSLVGPDPTAPCDTAACTAAYRYDARDRLVGAEDGHTTTTDYTLDPAGNITSEALSGGQAQTTTQTFVGNQLRTRSVNGQTRKYFYDAQGNLDCVTNDAGTQADCSPAAGATVSTSLVQDFAYDVLNRLSSSRSFTAGSETDSAFYTYDPLDRPIAETEQHGSDMRSISFRYRGIGNDVASEEQRDGQGGLISTKSYGYDQLGDKASLVVTPQGQSPTRLSYGYDPHGSISLLLGSNGTATAAYGYTPYGTTDTALTKGDAGATNPLNPYRYSSKRFDSGSATLDMGARRFSPDAGRFLQYDRYSLALDNLRLGRDPLTANRYALAGGNPIGFVEVDGHVVADEDENGNIVRRFRPRAVAGSAGHDVNVSGGNSAPASTETRQTQGLIPNFVSINGLFGHPDTLYDLLGYEDAKRCLRQYVSGDFAAFKSCALNAAAFLPPSKAARVAKIINKLRGARAGATVGRAASLDYRATFFAAHPELYCEVVVHHAVEQQVLHRYPGLFTAEEINSLENLRGIPVGDNPATHLSAIRKSWNSFYKAHPTATREQVLAQATRVDRQFGSGFLPGR